MPDDDEPAYPQADTRVTLPMIRAGLHFLLRHSPLPENPVHRMLMVERFYQVMALVRDHQPERAHRLAEEPLE